MRIASRVAATFRLDPIVVLDATPRVWLIRLAAHNRVVQEENEARERAREQQKRKKKG